MVKKVLFAVINQPIALPSSTSGDGCVVAVDAVNNSKAFMLGKRLYGKSVDAKLLADESVELKSFLS
jgi:hypothetical protein